MKIRITALLIAITLGAVRAQAGDVADLEAIEEAFVALAAKVEPTVVAIQTKNDPRSSRRRNGETPMVGSGVVIDAAGLILTNDHVSRSGDRVYVTLSTGQRHEAQVVGRDERSDLAVLRIARDDLVAAEFGDLQEVHVGQFALAMGNPYGTADDGRCSMSYGIVSALGRSLRALEEDGNKYYGNLIQTTADIHPGNSGGPLFDIHGRVVGINTAVESGSDMSGSLGYAIPLSSRTRRIIDQLSAGQSVRYGYLGVSIIPAERRRDLYVPDRDAWGVVIKEVYPRSPAERAALQEDDLILRYAAEPVRSVDHLIRLVGETPVGERVPMVVVRQDREMVINATIDERHTETPLAVRPD